MVGVGAFYALVPRRRRHTTPTHPPSGGRWPPSTLRNLSVRRSIFGFPQLQTPDEFKNIVQFSFVPGRGRTQGDQCRVQPTLPRLLIPLFNNGHEYSLNSLPSPHRSNLHLSVAVVQSSLPVRTTSIVVIATSAALTTHPTLKIPNSHKSAFYYTKLRDSRCDK